MPTFWQSAVLMKQCNHEINWVPTTVWHINVELQSCDSRCTISLVLLVAAQKQLSGFFLIIKTSYTLHGISIGGIVLPCLKSTDVGDKILVSH